ncbi:conserved exported hypothetical protein [Candidatus Sulfotelmatobacter kueseliae]|uniref:DUF5916 domain-containing protein n=1 Tax=Candidatus Sulfotelmatobacter kueseliae TaxID=2042962 RepID=A0A2U3JW43_9BACT|nr:conserved exported hypothetical protein [Candidatus Sulfotelmatobacter kueseliae]
MLAGLGAAAWAAPSSPGSHAGGRQTGTAEGLRTAEAVRVDQAPKLDGTLDDPLWQQASPLDNFLQREPYEGTPPTERTEVRILYTKRDVYFGIRCFDSAPQSIVATELRRDVSQGLDDSFEIIIDSAHDRRNAYVFQINPLGTQRDALITEEQLADFGDGDPGWDGVWTSEARITPEGWTATVGIPFSTLNFMQSDDVVWGINFKRFIRRKNEEDLWSAWRRVDGATRISRAGELHGISGIDSGRLFIVKPYGLTGFSHFPPSVAGTGYTPGTSALYTGGLDVKLGLRSNLVANFTANTDFADSDVDMQTFNLTPYKLFYPEKRQFFLENAGVFSFPLGGEQDSLFFSREIGIDPNTGEEVPVNGGAKVTGAIGKFELGVMDVDTRHSGPNPFANYAVLRVKRALWGGSYFGVMGIDKRSGNPSDPFNQTEGADTRLVFFRDLTVTAFAAESRSPGISSGQTDWGGSFHYRSNWLDLMGDHRRIGPNFNPEVGFLERQDCICDFLDADFKARPSIEGVRELNFEGSLFHAPDTQHVLQSQEWQSTFRMEMNNGSFTDDDIVDVNAQLLTSPFNLYKNVSIPVGEYTWTRHQLSYGSPRDQRLTFSAFERFGGYYNGRLNEARARATYRASEKLSFSLGQQWNRFRLGATTDPTGTTILPASAGDFSVVVGSFQTNYSFSRFLTLSGLVQMDTANDQAVSANIRLRWNYRPDSDLYVIYTAGQRFASLTAANPPQYYENRFVIKFTYSWQP